MSRWTLEDIERLRPGAVTSNATPKPTPQQNYQALGRMKSGKMNNTERAYSNLLEARLKVGEILKYWFEPMNLRIGENCFYKTDFLVMTKESYLELHEIKGFLTDDSLVKMRAVASIYPFKLRMFRLVKGQWEEREF